MANAQLFRSQRGALLPQTDTVNEAGGKAYAMSAKHALAQYAVTGCLNSTFYASAEAQLNKILELAKDVDVEFIAKTALYARTSGMMKDVPALLLAVLTARKDGLFPLSRVFHKVIDNGKMLRNYVQIVRSGVVGRKSFGTRPRALIREWLENAGERRLIDASIGTTPTLADVVKMVHPKTKDETRNAFYRWLLGKEYNSAHLFRSLNVFEQFKAGLPVGVPNVPFQMLTALPLTSEQWAEIAKNGGWHMVRMNLNTFLRHGVFALPGMVEIVANKLRDKESILRAKVFPYQLMAAFSHASDEMPISITEALQDAMDIALENVPQYSGQIVVCPDVSGSMQTAVTGGRDSATTKMKCIDVAALITAALLRQSKNAILLPFADVLKPIRLNPRDSVMTNAQHLASFGGGGTNCSLPLHALVEKKTKADLVVYVSDNESWLDNHMGRGTGTMNAWEAFKRINPKAKLVCIDLQPNSSIQAKERADILNIGGFSDTCFEMIRIFANNELSADHWVGVIDNVQLGS